MNNKKKSSTDFTDQLSSFVALTFTSNVITNATSIATSNVASNVTSNVMSNITSIFYLY